MLYSVSATDYRFKFHEKLLLADNFRLKIADKFAFIATYVCS